MSMTLKATIIAIVALLSAALGMAYDQSNPMAGAVIGALIGGLLTLLALTLFSSPHVQAPVEPDGADVDDALNQLARAALRLQVTPDVDPAVLVKAHALFEQLGILIVRLDQELNTNLDAIQLVGSITNIGRKYLPELIYAHTGLADDMRASNAEAFSAALDAIGQEVQTVTTQFDANDLSAATDTASTIVARFGRQDFINKHDGE